MTAAPHALTDEGEFLIDLVPQPRSPNRAIRKYIIAFFWELHMRFSSIALTLWLFPALVSSQDYQAEIDEYVLHPCWRVMLENNEYIDKSNIEGALALMAALQKSEVEKVMQSTLPLVSKMPDLGDRMAVCDFGRNLCIKSYNDAKVAR